MSDKEQIVEDLFTTVLTEGVNADGLHVKVENQESIQDIFTEKISSQVFTFLATTNTTNEENVIEVEDEDFEKLFRMTKVTFFDLQNEIQELENDSYDTNLLTTLWILGNTAPFKDIAKLLTIEETCIEAICKKYFRKIINLSSKYISWPSPSDMLSLEYMFEKEYEFPSVVGALGCLYISIKPTEDSITSNCSSTNFGHNTIILQAVCDTNLLFRDVFLGSPGTNSIKDVLKLSPLYNKLSNPESILEKTNKHLLGGTEHPQLDTLLTPYPFDEETDLTKEQVKFNALHSAAMSVLDKTFYIIENRFQRMKCLDSVDIEFATLALGSIYVLHNFTRIRGDSLDLRPTQREAN